MKTYKYKHKQIQWIGYLKNYKAYPRVKGSKNFVYLDERFTDFYPRLSPFILLLFLVLTFMLIYSENTLYYTYWLGALVGLCLYCAQALLLIKNYSYIKIGYNYYSGIVMISCTPISLKTTKQACRLIFYLKLLFFILFCFTWLTLDMHLIQFLLAILFFLMFDWPSNIQNLTVLKSVPANAVLYHHRASTYYLAEPEAE